MVYRLLFFDAESCMVTGYDLNMDNILGIGEESG
jgi:hypothetical protein